MTIRSWSINLNLLRNFFVRGSLGTVTGRTVKGLSVALHELVNDGVAHMGLPMHLQIAPANASTTAIHAAMNLLPTTQTILTGITDPDVTRVLSITGGIAGQTGNVVITYKNDWAEQKTATVALNGTATVEALVAAKDVVSIALPVETHTATPQVETAVAVGTVTGDGNATVTVTAAGMTNSPKAISVAVLNGDTASVWAGKVRTVLGADADVTARFAVSGTGANIVLTRLVPAADDGTLNIAYTNDTCTGITPDATSNNTTAGVAYDTVAVGYVNKFGLPYIVHNVACLLLKLFDGSTDAGTLAVDADEVEKNIFTIAGTPDGAKLLDLYYLVN